MLVQIASNSASNSGFVPSTFATESTYNNHRLGWQLLWLGSLCSKISSVQTLQMLSDYLLTFLLRYAYVLLHLLIVYFVDLINRWRLIITRLSSSISSCCNFSLCHCRQVFDVVSGLPDKLMLLLL